MNLLLVELGFLNWLLELNADVSVVPGPSRLYRLCEEVSKLTCARVKTQVSSETRAERGNVTVSLVDEVSDI